MKSNIDYLELYDIFLGFYSQALRRSGGIAAEALTRFRNRFHDHCIISDIDKDREAKGLCISCPRGFQNRLLRTVMRSDFDFGMIPTFSEHYDAFRDKLWYSTCIRDKTKHIIGSVDYVPKQSGLSKKGRLLGSYFKHGCRDILSSCGKAMIHMLHVLGLANCSTTSIAMIKKKIHQTNLDVLERTNAGKVVGYAVGKRDFDNFFGAVPHFLVERSVKWLENNWSERLSRRPYISGPKFKPRTYCSLQFAFTRAFKENLRNADSSHKLHNTFHSNTRAVKTKHWILHFRDVNYCVIFYIYCGFI